MDVPDTHGAKSAVVGNPSERRSGVVVEGWCDLCGGRSALTLAQHKGRTMIMVKSIPSS